MAIDNLRITTISCIRKHLNEYWAEYEKYGKCKYEMISVGDNNTTRVKIIKAILSVWVSIVVLAITAVFYIVLSECVAINLFEYLTVVLSLLIILLIGVFVSANRKRIIELTINTDYITVLTQKGEEFRYDFDKIKFRFVRMRNQRRRIKRRTNFFLIIKGTDQKQKFVLRAQEENDFRAYLIFLNLVLKKEDMSCITDEQLYYMYQKSRLGIRYSNI